MGLIDNTLAGAAANSYISLAEATGYANEYFTCISWLTAASGTQEACLTEATHLMESFKLRYNPSTSTQNLFFPRDVDLQEDGTYEIPDAIKRAQFLIAFNIYQMKTTMNEVDRLRGAGIVSYSLGDYSISLQENNGSFSFFNTTIRRLFYPYCQFFGRRVKKYSTVPVEVE